MAVIFGVITFLLMANCFVLWTFWSRSEKEYRELRKEADGLLDDLEIRDEQLKAMTISRDYYAERHDAAKKRELDLNKTCGEAIKQRDALSDLNEKLKADADSETAHCRTLEAQVTTIGQELQDAHERINDLVDRLEQIRTACDHPYHVPAMEEK